MSFTDCLNNFEFSHKGMWKDPYDSNHVKKGQMGDNNACACACSEATNCVAYVIYSSKDCWLYHTLSVEIPETTVDAYIKKISGNNYL